MRYVIGTAGHVDHGKSALIKSLTGIETAHLPEEKKRGMTIDLGFAYMKGENDSIIGIVDVPGHERFIRNMVAGTWALDCALLVVAADDGWMQMSTDHLRVLKAMEVENIILVINKCDAVDLDFIDLVEEDSQDKCLEILGRKLPIAKVSALNGDGIDALKSMILKELKEKKERPQETPFIYFDRVFLLKGIGTTITGTLKDGPITEEDVLTVYPGKIDCRIKSIQNHSHKVESIDRGTRVALNLKLMNKGKLKRGMVATGESEIPIQEGKELIIRLDQWFLDKGEELSSIKNHREVEIALGTAHAKGFLHFHRDDPSLARLSLDTVLAAKWNQPGVIIRQGGSQILASCHLIMAFDTYKKDKFRAIFEVCRNREIKSYPLLVLHQNGYLKKSHKTESIDKADEEITLLGTWYIVSKYLKEIKNCLIELSKEKSGGFAINETSLKLPEELLVLCLDSLVIEKKIEQSGRIYQQPGFKETVTPAGEEILNLALEAGGKGIEANKITVLGGKKEIRNLQRMKKLIHLEDYLYFHSDVFEKYKDIILNIKGKGEIISISDAREKTELSRKYIIPIFNIMEEMKLLQREGNDRKVI